MVKWKPIDVISLVLIVSCVSMIFFGFDGQIKFTLLVIVGLYYGIDLTPFIKLGRVIRKKEEE